MQNMQTFYTRLASAEHQDNPYVSYLVRLMQLSPSTIASLKTVLWWNDWSSVAE
jgi:hypothetical protein